MNVVAPILHFGATRRHSLALIEGERAITYGELADLIRRAAGRFVELGFRRGDRIGLCLKDTADQIVALLAAAHLGAVSVPLDWRARPSENARFIEALDLSYLLVEPGARSHATRPTIALDDHWRDTVARTAPILETDGRWDDPSAISATSGSTGQPKFSVMTHSQFYFAVIGMLELMALSGSHRFLCNMPMYYSGGRNSCLAHLLRGDCVVLYPSLFSPDEYVDIVARRAITIGGLVPSMVRQLLAKQGPQPLLPSLAMLFSTGAPLFAEEKREAARRLSPRFHERYGAAETLAISILRPTDFETRADSVGQPHSLAEITIVDDHDQPLPAGVAGRLRYRGPGLGSPLPGAPETANFRGGFFYPGEIARLDEDGYIFLQGRTSDVIMRSGAKIYPAEIEAALLEHPGVADAAAFGVRDDGNEDAVVAFVTPRAELPLGELIAHCRTRLSPHKVPKQFRFIDVMPMNTAGKIDKSALARKFAESSDLPPKLKS